MSDFLQTLLGVLFLWFGVQKLTYRRKQKSYFFEALRLRPGMVWTTVFGSLELLIGLLFIGNSDTVFASALASLILIGCTWVAFARPGLLKMPVVIYPILLACALFLLYTQLHMHIR